MATRLRFGNPVEQDIRALAAYGKKKTPSILLPPTRTTLGGTSYGPPPQPLNATGLPGTPPSAGPTATDPSQQGQLGAGGAIQFDLDGSIRDASKETGLDESFIRAIMAQETGGIKDPNTAVSPKGAYGPMQLMEDTAKEVGVDRMDPRQNILGGARYMKKMLSDPFIKGNVELALAAYNAGLGAVKKYNGIPPFRETQDYVSKIKDRMLGKIPTTGPGGVPVAVAQQDQSPSGSTLFGREAPKFYDPMRVYRMAGVPAPYQPDAADIAEKVETAPPKEFSDFVRRPNMPEPNMSDDRVREIWSDPAIQSAWMSGDTREEREKAIGDIQMERWRREQSPGYAFMSKLATWAGQPLQRGSAASILRKGAQMSAATGGKTELVEQQLGLLPIGRLGRQLTEAGLLPSSAYMAGKQAMDQPESQAGRIALAPFQFAESVLSEYPFFGMGRVGGKAGIEVLKKFGLPAASKLIPFIETGATFAGPGAVQGTVEGGPMEGLRQAAEGFAQGVMLHGGKAIGQGLGGPLVETVGRGFRQKRPLTGWAGGLAGEVGGLVAGPHLIGGQPVESMGQVAEELAGTLGGVTGLRMGGFAGRGIENLKARKSIQDRASQIFASGKAKSPSEALNIASAEFRAKASGRPQAGPTPRERGIPTLQDFLHGIAERRGIHPRDMVGPVGDAAIKQWSDLYAADLNLPDAMDWQRHRAHQLMTSEGVEDQAARIQAANEYEALIKSKFNESKATKLTGRAGKLVDKLAAPIRKVGGMELGKKPAPEPSGPTPATSVARAASAPIQRRIQEQTFEEFVQDVGKGAYGEGMTKAAFPTLATVYAASVERAIREGFKVKDKVKASAKRARQAISGARAAGAKPTPESIAPKVPEPVKMSPDERVERLENRIRVDHEVRRQVETEIVKRAVETGMLDPRTNKPLKSIRTARQLGFRWAARTWNKMFPDTELPKSLTIESLKAAPPEPPAPPAPAPTPREEQKTRLSMVNRMAEVMHERNKVEGARAALRQLGANVPDEAKAAEYAATAQKHADTIEAAKGKIEAVERAYAEKYGKGGVEKLRKQAEAEVERLRASERAKPAPPRPVAPEEKVAAETKGAEDLARTVAEGNVADELEKLLAAGGGTAEAAGPEKEVPQEAAPPPDRRSETDFEAQATQARRNYLEAERALRKGKTPPGAKAAPRNLTAEDRANWKAQRDKAADELNAVLDAHKAKFGDEKGRALRVKLGGILLPKYANEPEPRRMPPVGVPTPPGEPTSKDVMKAVHKLIEGHEPRMQRYLKDWLSWHLGYGKGAEPDPRKYSGIGGANKKVKPAYDAVDEIRRILKWGANAAGPEARGGPQRPLPPAPPGGGPPAPPAPVEAGPPGGEAPEKPHVVGGIRQDGTPMAFIRMRDGRYHGLDSKGRPDAEVGAMNPKDVVDYAKKNEIRLLAKPLPKRGEPVEPTSPTPATPAATLPAAPAPAAPVGGAAPKLEKIPWDDSTTDLEGQGELPELPLEKDETLAVTPEGFRFKLKKLADGTFKPLGMRGEDMILGGDGPDGTFTPDGLKGYLEATNTTFGGKALTKPTTPTPPPETPTPPAEPTAPEGEVPAPENKAKTPSIKYKPEVPELADEEDAPVTVDDVAGGIADELGKLLPPKAAPAPIPAPPKVEDLPKGRAWVRLKQGLKEGSDYPKSAPDDLRPEGKGISVGIEEARGYSEVRYDKVAPPGESSTGEPSPISETVLADVKKAVDKFNVESPTKQPAPYDEDVKSKAEQEIIDLRQVVIPRAESDVAHRKASASKPIEQRKTLLRKINKYIKRYGTDASDDIVRIGELVEAELRDKTTRPEKLEKGVETTIPTVLMQEGTSKVWKVKPDATPEDVHKQLEELVALKPGLIKRQSAKSDAAKLLAAQIKALADWEQKSAQDLIASELGNDLPTDLKSLVTEDLKTGKVSISPDASTEQLEAIRQFAKKKGVWASGPDMGRWQRIEMAAIQASKGTGTAPVANDLILRDNGNVWVVKKTGAKIVNALDPRDNVRVEMVTGQISKNPDGYYHFDAYELFDGKPGPNAANGMKLFAEIVGLRRQMQHFFIQSEGKKVSAKKATELRAAIKLNEQKVATAKRTFWEIFGSERTNSAMDKVEAIMSNSYLKKRFQEEKLPLKLPGEQAKELPGHTDVRTRWVNAKIVNFDPVRFQYKLDRNERGETGSMAGVKKWDTTLAGAVEVWFDPKDEKTYVVNGHNRLAYALDNLDQLPKNRKGESILKVHYIQADTPEGAKSVGALRNIAEGRGKETDAMDFFLHNDITTQEAAENLGLAVLGEPMVRKGLALARLAGPLRSAVKSGSLEMGKAVAIGANLENHDLQWKLYTEMLKYEKSGSRRMTIEDIRVSANRLQYEVEHGKTTKTVQEDLFGKTEHTATNYFNQIRIQNKIAELIKDTRTTFNFVSKGAHMKRLTEAGNKLDPEKNRQLSQSAEMLVGTYERAVPSADYPRGEAWAGGPEVNDILDKAGEAASKGESLDKIRDRIYPEIVSVLEDALKRGGFLGDEGGKKSVGSGLFQEEGPGAGGRGSLDEGPTAPPRAKSKELKKTEAADNSDLGRKLFEEDKIDIRLPGVEREPLPDWLREDMERQGINVNRRLNDIDLHNRSIQEALALESPEDLEREGIVKENGVFVYRRRNIDSYRDSEPKLITPQRFLEVMSDRENLVKLGRVGIRAVESGNRDLGAFARSLDMAYPGISKAMPEGMLEKLHRASIAGADSIVRSQENAKPKPVAPAAPQPKSDAGEGGEGGAGTTRVRGGSGRGEPGHGDTRRPPPEGNPIVTARAAQTAPADPRGLEEDIKRGLAPHQIQGAAKTISAIDQKGGFILADGTGTGKTWEELAIAEHYRRKGSPVIIVSPAQVISPNWTTRKFGGAFRKAADLMGVDVTLIRGGKIEPGRIHLTTYEMMQKLELAGIPKDTIVIFDEAHHLKNVENPSNPSARGKFGMALARKSKGVVFATATPMDNAHHLFYLIRAGITEGGTLDEALTKLGMIQKTVKFRMKNGQPGSKEIWAINPNVGREGFRNRLHALKTRLTAAGYMLKRELSMQGINIWFHHVRLPDEVYDDMRKINEGMGPLESVSGWKKSQILMNMRRQQEPGKISAAIRMAQDSLSKGRKAIIYVARVNYSAAQTKSPIFDMAGNIVDYNVEIHAESEGTAKLLMHALAEAGIPKEQVAELYGRMTSKQSLAAMEAFQSGKAKVMVATVEKGGTGISLDDMVGNQPRDLIVLTPPFSGMDNAQMIGRVWRLNTKSKPMIHYIFGDTVADAWNSGIIADKMRTLGASTAGEIKKLNMVDPDIDTQDDYTSDMFYRRFIPESTARDIINRHGEDAFGTELTKRVMSARTQDGGPLYEVAGSFGPNGGDIDLGPGSSARGLLNARSLEEPRSRVREILKAEGHMVMRGQKIESPDDIATLFAAKDFHESVEKIYALAIRKEADGTQKVLGVFLEGVGGKDFVDISSHGNLVKDLLSVGANAFAISHNHPSENSAPSKNDIELTAEMKTRYRDMPGELEFLGHYIMDKGEYSFVGPDGNPVYTRRSFAWYDNGPVEYQVPILKRGTSIESQPGQQISQPDQVMGIIRDHLEPGKALAMFVDSQARLSGVLALDRTLSDMIRLASSSRDAAQRMATEIARAGAAFPGSRVILAGSHDPSMGMEQTQALTQALEGAYGHRGDPVVEVGGYVFTRTNGEGKPVLAESMRPINRPRPTPGGLRTSDTFRDNVTPSGTTTPEELKEKIGKRGIKQPEYDQLSPEDKIRHVLGRISEANSPEHLTNIMMPGKTDYYVHALPDREYAQILDAASSKLKEMDLSKGGETAANILGAKIAAGDRTAFLSSRSVKLAQRDVAQLVSRMAHPLEALKRIGKDLTRETINVMAVVYEEADFMLHFGKIGIWSEIMVGTKHRIIPGREASPFSEEGIRRARILWRVASTPQAMIDLPEGAQYGKWKKTDWMADRKAVDEFEGWGERGQEALTNLRAVMNDAYRRLKDEGHLGAIVNVPFEIGPDGEIQYLYAPLQRVQVEHVQMPWEKQHEILDITGVPEVSYHPHLKRRGKDNIGMDELNPHRLYNGYIRSTARRVWLTEVLGKWREIKAALPGEETSALGIMVTEKKYLQDWIDKWLGRPSKSDIYVDRKMAELDNYFADLTGKRLSRMPLIQRAFNPRFLSRLNRSAMMLEYLRLFGGITPTIMWNSTQAINNVLIGGLPAVKAYAGLFTREGWSEIRKSRVVADYEAMYTMPSYGEDRANNMYRMLMIANSLPEAINRGAAVLMEAQRARDMGLSDTDATMLVKARASQISRLRPIVVEPGFISKMVGRGPATFTPHYEYTAGQKMGRIASETAQFNYDPASSSPYLNGNWRFVFGLWSYPTRQFYFAWKPFLKTLPEIPGKISELPTRMKAAAEAQGLNYSSLFSRDTLYQQNNFWRFAAYVGVMATLPFILKELTGSPFGSQVGIRSTLPFSAGPLSMDTYRLVTGLTKVASAYDVTAPYKGKKLAGQRYIAIPELRQLAGDWHPRKWRGVKTAKALMAGDTLGAFGLNTIPQSQRRN